MAAEKRKGNIHEKRDPSVGNLVACGGIGWGGSARFFCKRAPAGGLEAMGRTEFLGNHDFIRWRRGAGNRKTVWEEMIG